MMNGLSIKYDPAMNNNEILFVSKWMELETTMPGSERQRSHVFSHIWKADPKVKHIHKL
jgi:hypothetical protein